MKKNIISLISFFVLVSPLMVVTGCRSFSEKYYYSSLDLQLRLIESIHNDSGVPLFIVRLFHNKVIGTILDTYTIYIRYWDIIFLVTFVTFLGIFGFIYSIYSELSARTARKVIWALLIHLLLYPLLELLLKPELPFLVKAGIYFLPFYVISILGIRKFVSPKSSISHKRVFLVVLLILVSVWWLIVYNPINLKYCAL